MKIPKDNNSFIVRECEKIEKVNKNKIKIIIVIVVSLIIFLSGYCLAKYETAKDVLTNSKIAMPIINVEGEVTSKISALSNIGYYDFTVKNYNQEKVSDVSLNYSIEIISSTDESISFKLYKGEEEINLENNKTEPIYIESLNQVEHSYRLEVMYDKTKSNSQKDILEDVQIKVHSEQARL